MQVGLQADLLIVGKRLLFFWHAVLFRRPGAQIDVPAALGTEGAERAFGSPRHRLAASGAGNYAGNWSLRRAHIETRPTGQNVRLKNGRMLVLARRLVFMFSLGYLSSYPLNGRCSRFCQLFQQRKNTDIVPSYIALWPCLELRGVNARAKAVTKAKTISREHQPAC